MKTVKEFFVEIFEQFSTHHSCIDSYYLAVIEFERKTDFQSPYPDFHSFIRTYYKSWRPKKQHNNISQTYTTSL